MKMKKDLYKVTLNWHGEIHEFYTHATSETKALRQACGRLSNRVGRLYKHVRPKFSDKDNYNIERR